MENKRQVQSLLSKSKSIVRLKPRNPEEKSSSSIMVQALCDFKQDQVRHFSICATDVQVKKKNVCMCFWFSTGVGKQRPGGRM